MFSDSGKFTIVGHRGCRNGVAENTLAAIQQGFAEGADLIEVDVWQVGDEVVLFHDRLCGGAVPGTGRVKDLPLAEIRRAIEAPGLDEVLDWLGPDRAINLELKDPDCTAATLSCVRRFQERSGASAGNFLFSSFNHSQLRQLKSLAPEYDIGALIDGIPHDLAACGEALGARTLHPCVDFIDAELVDDARSRGLKVIPYTVNTDADVNRLRAMGIDGVFTDFPARIRALISGK